MRVSQLSAVLLVGVALASCGGGSDEDKAKETVTQFFSALEKKDTAKLCDDLLTEDFIQLTTGATGDRAKDECRRQFSTFREPNVELGKVGKVEIDGDTASVAASVKRMGQTQPQ